MSAIRRYMLEIYLYKNPFLILQLMVLFLSSTFISCTSDHEIRILVTGDILLSRNVREEYRKKGEFPWQYTQALFQQADLVVGNLEGFVSDNYGDISGTGPLVFDIHKEDILMLRKAGFHIITTANNHSRHLDSLCVSNTTNVLLGNEVIPVGFDNSPYFYTVGDLVIAVVAINTIPGKSVSVEDVPSLEVMQKLRLAKTLANVVIVSIHWGSELLEWPDKKQRTMAKWLVECGTDIIVGSHPHVIQKPEMIKGKPVFFSLGNHLFDQKYPATKEGLIADIRIKNGNTYCSGILTHTVPNSFFPEVTGNIDVQWKPIQVNKSFEAGKYLFRPLTIHGRQKYNLCLQAFHKAKKAWRTLPMSIVSVDKAMFDSNNEYLFVLEKHYSNMDDEISVRPYIYHVDEKGIHALWRGSALAWPLVDAQVLPSDRSVLCALHRGDSFIHIDKTTNDRRVMAYEWNGFGFNGVSDSAKCEDCKKLYASFSNLDSD